MTNTAAFVETATVTEAPKAKRGRPAKYANAAERQAAYRAANAVKTLRLDGKIAPTIAKLAEQFDTTETAVVNNMLRFALANRNWVTQGIGGWQIKDARCTTGRRPAAPTDDLFPEFPLV